MWWNEAPKNEGGRTGAGGEGGGGKYMLFGVVRNVGDCWDLGMVMAEIVA